MIWRFNEITQVYGTIMKKLIHKMVGDGIIDTIDFEIAISKEKDLKEDGVVISYSDKFLQYIKC